MSKTTNPVIFLSHSHEDRDEALLIYKLLKKNKADPYLDQEEIYPSDHLPKKILKGISSCEKFMLLWSYNAENSSWVEHEWHMAFELKKRIIPYVLDGKPLPDALQNFVYIDKSDQEHGHAELFRAVFGRVLDNAEGVDMFPGKWEVDISVPDGMGNKVKYDLELKANGQISGLINAVPTGMFGGVAGLVGGELGVDLGFMFQPTPVRGSWSYKEGTGLHLDLIQSAYGNQFPFKVDVYTTGTGKNVLYGTGTGGAQVTLRRKGK